MVQESLKERETGSQLPTHPLYLSPLAIITQHKQVILLCWSIRPTPRRKRGGRPGPNSKYLVFRNTKMEPELEFQGESHSPKIPFTSRSGRFPTNQKGDLFSDIPIYTPSFAVTPRPPTAARWLKRQHVASPAGDGLAVRLAAEVRVSESVELVAFGCWTLKLPIRKGIG